MCTPLTRFFRFNLLWILLIIIIVAFLRAPTLSSRMWNVDEGIQAAIADIILEGGIPYKNAVCQRGPVTFYVYALTFYLFGKNNIAATHFVLLFLLIITLIMIYLIGCGAGNTSSGVLSAVFFAFTSSLAWGYDHTYAFHTEFCLIFFTCLGSLLFLRGLLSRHDFLLAVLSGASYGLAFFSKQPAVFDLLAPIILLLYLGFLKDKYSDLEIRGWKTILIRFVGLIVGFSSITIAWSWFFYSNGAWEDYKFYFFTYNFEYYVPAIPLSHRLLLIPASFGQTCNSSLGMGVTALIGLLFVLFKVSSDRNSDHSNVTQIFILIWAVSSFIGGSMTGRLYGHYMIQVLPSWSVLSALAWNSIAKSALNSDASSTPKKIRDLRLRIGLAGIALMVGMLAAGYFRLVPSTLAYLRKEGRIGAAAASKDIQGFSRFDPENIVVPYIKQTTTPDSKIFIWGFKPFIYVQADRQPASRYVYCAHIAGLIPWEEGYPKPVPGGIDILVSELIKNKPVLIIDTSCNKEDVFSEFPMSSFDNLWNFVQKNYYLEKSLAGFNLYRLRR